jgi:hypothetical protein
MRFSSQVANALSNSSGPLASIGNSSTFSASAVDYLIILCDEAFSAPSDASARADRISREIPLFREFPCYAI